MAEKHKLSDNSSVNSPWNSGHKRPRRSDEQKHQSRSEDIFDTSIGQKQLQSHVQKHQSRPKDIFDASIEGQKQFGNKLRHNGDIVIPKPPTTALNRIAQFTKLSYELEHDPAFIEEFRKIAGEEGSNGALELAKHVNSQRGVLAVLAQQLSDPPHEHMETQEHPSASNLFEDHLPPLPPILDPEMETKVFTTASAISARERTHIDSYERLEWLGDGYLEIITRRIIFKLLSDKSEAVMSTITQDFVRNENLARFSLAYGFDERLRMSANHIAQTFSHAKKSMTKIYGDVFEAYIAAVIESDPAAGYKTAYKWIESLVKPTILKYTTVVPINDYAKEQLARKLLGKDIKIRYEEYKPAAPVKGGSIFYYNVYLDGWGHTHQFLGSGEGSSKSQAEKLAAMDALTNTTTAIICAIKREYDTLVKIERQKPNGPDPAVLAALDKKYKAIAVE